MDIRPLTPFLSVSPQIGTGDVGTLAAQGFHAVINNRPDGEGEGQPSSAEIEAAARRCGLDYRHIPITPGQLTDDKVAAFRAALDELKGQVLAFCRTGTRSASLWALSEAGRREPERIIEQAAEAGYDLSALRQRIDARATVPGG
jgi:sulfide:quinone oxidoreductase